MPPQLLTPSTILGLQRSLGNTAVSRLLAPAMGKSPMPRSSAGLVQRYPETVFQQPYDNWAEATGAVKASESGATGVYFLKGKSGLLGGRGQVAKADFGPVRDVVVKPLVGHGRRLQAPVEYSPEQAQMGETILKEFGIDAPESRTVLPGQPEFDQLKAVSESRGGRGFPKDINSVKVMGKVQGMGLGSLLPSIPDGKHTTPAWPVGSEHVDRLIDVLRDDARWEKIGTIMVADALMGNEDRFVQGATLHTNLDNYMLTLDSIVPIDTAAILEESVDNTASEDLGLESLQALINPAKLDRMLNVMLSGMEAKLEKAPPATPGFQPLAYFQGLFLDVDRTRLRGYVGKGVGSGLKTVRALASIKERPTEEREQKREGRTRIKQQASTNITPQGPQQVGTRAEKSNLQTGYSNLRARAKYANEYMKLAESGVDHDEAHAQATKIAEEYYDRKRDEWREAETGGVELTEHMQRAVAAAGIPGGDVMLVRIALHRAGLNAKDQDQLLHIRPGTAKLFLRGKKDTVDQRLETIRAGLLQVFVNDLHRGMTPTKLRKSVADARARAEAVLALRVYDPPNPKGARLQAIVDGLRANRIPRQFVAEAFPTGA